MKRYLLNTNSKKIHDLKFSDGRCKISGMKEECKVYFETLEAAEKYPSASNPLGKRCSICEKNKISNKISEEFKQNEN